MIAGEKKSKTTIVTILMMMMTMMTIMIVVGVALMMTVTMTGQWSHRYDESSF